MTQVKPEPLTALIMWRASQRMPNGGRMNQRQAGALFGVGQVTYGRWELGIQNPKEDEARKVVEATKGAVSMPMLGYPG